MEQRLLAVFKKQAVPSNLETFATKWNYNTATQTWPHCENETFPNYIGRCRMVFFPPWNCGFKCFTRLTWRSDPWWKPLFFGGVLIISGLIPIKGWRISPSVRHQWDIYIFGAGFTNPNHNTVDGWNPAITTWDEKKNAVNNGINYQPELVFSPDLSTINRLSVVSHFLFVTFPDFIKVEGCIATNSQRFVRRAPCLAQHFARHFFRTGGFWMAFFRRENSKITPTRWLLVEI